MKPLFFLLCAVFLLAGAPVAQAVSESTQSAFLFADRKDWDNARLHAKRSGNDALVTLIAWQYLLDQTSGASFQEIRDFMQKHPDWPQQQRLQLRAEQSIRMSSPESAELSAWFDANPPISGAGKIALAEIMLESSSSNRERIDFLLRDGWRNGDFDETEEKRLLSVYGNRLRTEDHRQRADRLLWEEKTTAALRMLDILPAADRSLVRARAALLQNDRDAPALVAALNARQKKDAGLIFARMQWRARSGDELGVREMLLEAPTPLPYAEKWWRQRDTQVRKAIAEGDWKLARRLLSGHGLSSGAEFADAKWLEGWLDLQQMNKPQEAYQAFYAMFDAVKFPVSKARAAYWAGRAAENLNDAEAAKSWYVTASSYPTTFYGQLAAQKLGGGAPLNLPASPAVSPEARQKFNARLLTRAFRIAVDADEKELATLLLNQMIDGSPSAQESALAAELAEEAHSRTLGVRAAKRAMQNGIVLTDAGYPKTKLPTDLALEPALALAITRQESEFDARAESRAGALGLMQLLPSTAREVARKNDIAFSQPKLFDGSYNITLGSLYLDRLINGFDGSYVQAIAAYNAGPGRVREWRNTFGAPSGSAEKIVDWIEKIPFSETRNYVQRVLENLQVYRHLLAGKETPKLRIVEDLER